MDWRFGTPSALGTPFSIGRRNHVQIAAFLHSDWLPPISPNFYTSLRGNTSSQNTSQTTHLPTYMERPEGSEDPCKNQPTWERARKPHGIPRPNASRYAKCLQFNNRIRSYSNVLRILSRILAKLALIGSMLNHDRRCISTWIDDLALVFFSIGHRTC